MKSKAIDYVLVYIGNDLSLWQKNNENQYKKIKNATTPAAQGQYTRLKQISHIPLTIQALIKNYRKSDETEEKFVNQLSQMHAKLNTILASIEKVLMNKGLIATQQAILEKSINLLAALIKQPEPAQAKQLLAAYLASLGPYLKQNMLDSTKAQVHEIDQLLEGWGLKNTSVLKNTRVLVVGPHGPRQGQVDMQYYTKLYQTVGEQQPDDIENNYLYYIEMLPWQMQNLDIEKHLIQNFLMGSEYNKTIGKKVLNNRYGMFRDILEKSAPEAIDEVLLNKN
ncbi:Uncharacterised protein [Legionella beliardensis]|uniref:Uncharacterized protein n=1 Tax=Legionella beliardensis TaxID=91822 RepID=A0A378I5C3_9GAMM|nr:hypothetical protein [Legionella beliardensis]STX30223.1 Uncharacterised protein [Legionella beliardensis]